MLASLENLALRLPGLPEGEVPVSYDDKPFQRHPLCTCPELTWDAVTGRAAPPDLDACRARAVAGIDPHPLLDADYLHEITKQFLSDHGASTA